jgi:predicted N-formylglutamate amidohydrolase
MEDRLLVEIASYGTLLATDDPPPVVVDNPHGRSSFLLIGDHAGNLIPACVNNLGLDDDERARHIAWDIGIGALGKLLAVRLDAVFVRQSYSRLVIDSNRSPYSSEAVMESSDGTEIPGNLGLTAEQLSSRIAEIHQPYHAAISAEITRRESAGLQTIVIALHSFTPRMSGLQRPWEIGVLFDGGETSFARALLTALNDRPGLVVGENQPYRMDDTDYTVPHHCYGRGIPYAELEIRQDLLAEDSDIVRWADLLIDALAVSAAT